jgi:hypothetical protein
MRSLALILLTSSFFTACMTDTDKALWSEAKETFATGRFASLNESQTEESAIVSSDAAKASDETEVKAKDPAPARLSEPGQATTGR